MIIMPSSYIPRLVPNNSRNNWKQKIKAQNKRVKHNRARNKAARKSRKRNTKK